MSKNSARNWRFTRSVSLVVFRRPRSALKNLGPRRMFLSRGAKCARCVGLEPGDVKPPGNLLPVRAAVAKLGASAAYIIGLVRADAAGRIVHAARHRDWEAALARHQRIELPSRKKLAQQSALRPRDLVLRSQRGGPNSPKNFLTCIVFSLVLVPYTLPGADHWLNSWQAVQARLALCARWQSTQAFILISSTG
jgi:hypothetical protein